MVTATTTCHNASSSNILNSAKIVAHLAKGQSWALKSQELKKCTLCTRLVICDVECPSTGHLTPENGDWECGRCKCMLLL
ncbi:Hypothetical predicted protein [Podarcis lilfordi]|uniref:Uncharacterized protein n=1 Tax=Podarcis lilfordi TaxID=74358 RepID=A0AA35PKQ9_9SAUR|nr:Hypothetical predicted protein [Podarcis lilfordi]